MLAKLFVQIVGLGLLVAVATAGDSGVTDSAFRRVVTFLERERFYG